MTIGLSFRGHAGVGPPPGSRAGGLGYYAPREGYPKAGDQPQAPEDSVQSSQGRTGRGLVLEVNGFGHRP